MLVVIENVIDKQTVAEFKQQLEKANWQDGQNTAGSLSARVKSNLQLADSSVLAKQLSKHILAAVSQHPLFVSACLPSKIYPPKFNCYQNGGHYGTHIDSAIMQLPDSFEPIRSDISATLFISEPEEYKGGELSIETQFGMQQIKLSAGDMVLYPSTSLHQVLPVTHGARICSFFWLQSLIKDETQRSLLFDLDQSIQTLSQENNQQNNETLHAEIVRLTGIYHNLLRRAADL